jgi:hypothetical protein
LGGGADSLIDRQIGKEGADFGFGQIVWMSLLMEENKAFDPIPVSVSCSRTVMFDSYGGVDLIDEFWLGHKKEPQVRSIQEGKRSSIDIFDFEHLVNLYRLPNGGNIPPGLGFRFHVRCLCLVE